MEKIMEWLRLRLFISILIFGPRFIFADTNPTEASVLRDVYNSLTSRDKLNNWNSGDPCAVPWIGVTCSGQSITELKLSGLGLSGPMSYQLSSLKSLTILDLSTNNFLNQIPYGLPPNATRINLAGNNFNGGLPYSISSMKSLEYLNVSHNHLQGQLGDMFSSLSSLSTLDVSYNILSGSLPQSFGLLASMTTMDLENNQFTGNINLLGNLSLENLNVANNQFTGYIPEQLKSINLKKDGNSWSSGAAPPPPPGTPPLSPKKRNHKSSGNSNQSNSNGSNKSGLGGGTIAAIVISILVVGAIVAFFLIRRRRTRSTSSDIEKLNNQHLSYLDSNEVQDKKYDNQPLANAASNGVEETKSVHAPPTISSKTFETPTPISLRPPPIERHKSFDEESFSKKPIAKKVNAEEIDAKLYSVAELQMATGSFSAECLIGEGSLGRAYRAQFDDGKVLAVKRVDPSALPNHLEDFTEIVASISHLRHPNITELVGYCSQHGQHLLVYEFHSNGSLHDLMHLSDEDSKPLEWNSRVTIALGTARALEYLHEVCSPSIVHKNIKSSNILLDLELNPHLSDSGLASYISNAEQALNDGSGYSAPEVAMSGQYTLKSDVYSFGVAMLELLTGRKPFDSSRPRSEQMLVRWATPQLHDIDALVKMVDPSLGGLYSVKSLSRFADVIALCVQPEPEFRPPMSEVVQALVRLVQRANMSKRTVGTEK